MHIRSLIVVVLVSAASAAETLSFDDCVREAAMSNPDLLVQRSVLKSNDFQVYGSYYNFYPQLSANVNLNYGNSSTVSTLVTAPSTSSSPSLTVAPSISLVQNIFAGFADQARVAFASANREAVEADLAATKAKVSADLRNAFAALVFAQDSIKLGENIKARRDENYKLVSLLFESGREDYGSVLLAKAYLDQSELLIAQSKRALFSASIQLAKLMGRESSGDLRVTGKVPLVTPEENPDFEMLAQTVPDYRKAIAQEKAALAQKVTARSPFFPNIDFTSSASLVAGPNSQNTQWLIGLSVSWPFFNGGRDYYALKSATQAVTTAQLNKLAIQRTDTSTLALAYRDYVDSIAQLKVDKSFVTALATQEKIAKENYNNGLLTFTNWDIIETGYITRQQTVLNDERNLVSTGAAWELAKGSGVIP